MSSKETIKYIAITLAVIALLVAVLAPLSKQASEAERLQREYQGCLYNITSGPGAQYYNRGTCEVDSDEEGRMYVNTYYYDR